MSDETALAKTQRSEIARADSLLSFIQQAATDPACDVNKLKELVALAEHMQDREIRLSEENRRRVAEEAFSAALRAAQEQMRPIVRDAYNNQTQSKYARMETIDRAIRPIYAKNGFSFSYGTLEPRHPGSVRVVCHVSHEAGHSRDYDLEGELDTVGPKGTGTKTPIQGLGSTVSYLRKYLKLMVGDLTLVDDDTDGQRMEEIDEAQLVGVTKIYKACDMNEDEVNGFLTFMGITALSEIRKFDYEKAMNMLRAKFSQKSKERRNAHPA